jgi:hypothetical protein
MIASLILPTCNTFLDRLPESNGKFLFNGGDDPAGHGIYDIAAGTFTQGKTPDVMFLASIPHPFVPRNAAIDAAMVDIFQKVYVEPLKRNGDVDEVADAEADAACFLKFITMALCGWGYKTKQFFSYIGDTNCGKGVVTRAMKNAFGDLVDTYSLAELSFQPLNGQDPELRWKWYMQMVLKGTRLALANEAPVSDGTRTGDASSTIDGTTFRKAVSGGDLIDARPLGSNGGKGSIKLPTCLTLGAFTNDKMRITPSPSVEPAIGNKLKYCFRARGSYVEAHELDQSKPELKPKDPELERLLATPLYVAAHQWLVFAAYERMAEDEKKEGGAIFRPRRVCEESEDWIKDDGRSFQDSFGKDFVATGRIGDRIETKLVTDAMKKSVKGLSDRKIGDCVRAVVCAAIAAAGGWLPEHEEEAKLKVKKDGSRDITSHHAGNVVYYHGILTREEFQHREALREQGAVVLKAAGGLPKEARRAAAKAKAEAAVAAAKLAQEELAALDKDMEGEHGA